MRARGLLAAGTALAGMELFNRSVALPYEELEWQLPVEPTFWQWRYGRVAVYQAGSPDNPPLLLLHGQNAAASADEMRQPFERLSERFHVYAPDLLGYGLSDRPDIEYTPDLYTELIEDILKEVVQQPAYVLASSLTSAYAIQAAYEAPEWIRALVLVSPTGLTALTRQSPAGKAIGALFRIPVVGQALYNGLASHASIRYFLEGQTYFDSTLVTDGMVERYYRRSHVPGARYAPAAFVSGQLYWDVNDVWPQLEQPVLIVWGKEARFTPPEHAIQFVATNPNTDVEEIGASGIIPHDEQPEQFANMVGNWLQRL